MLRVLVSDSMQTITYTLSLNGTTWTHAWWDLTGREGPITIRIELASATATVVVDEISLGSTQIGVYRAYLPIVQRHMN